MAVDVRPAGVGEPPTPRGAGVVDEHVQLAVLALDRLGDPPPAVGFGEVDGNTVATPSSVGQRLEALATARNEDHPRIGLAREPSCRRLADPGRGPGDQGDECHRRASLPGTSLSRLDRAPSQNRDQGESAMDYVNLGATGVRVSRICLGMMSFGPHESREWAIPESEAEPIVRRAVDAGINFYDTADTYNGGQSEVITGSLLRKMFGMREEYVLATKVFMQTMPGPNGGGLSRKHIIASIDASLARLELDYVDLYQIHRWDPNTPIEETMEALHDVVKSGKARYIGASSMFAWQFAKAQRLASTPFVSMQNHYNLIYREEEREMIPQCIDQGVAVIPWSPLARGMLAGNRTRSGEKVTARAQTDAFGDLLYKPEIDFDVIERADEVAAARGVPTAQVALAWLIQRPGVTAPIVGATKLAHLEDAIAAEQLSLGGEEIAALEERYVPHAIAGHR